MGRSGDVRDRAFQGLVVPVVLLDATMNGIVRDDDILRLRCSTVVHEENLTWTTSSFLQMAAAIQAVNAEQRNGPKLCEMLELDPVTSHHPISGERRVFDEMLDVLDDLPLRDAPSRWDDAGEFDAIAQMLNEAGAIAFVDGTSLSAEIPFGPRGGSIAANGESHLIMITTEPHRAIGSGVRLRLALRRWPEVAGVQVFPLDLNGWECQQPPAAHLFGSWTIEADRTSTPYFTCFIPNALYRPGVLANLTLSMAVRARTVSELIPASP